MLSLAHTLISLPLAFWLNEPWLIVPVAFVGHLFCDTLPHWNIYPGEFRRYPYELIALEILTGLLLAWWVTGDVFFTWPVWLAIAGGNLPDVLHGFWDLTPPHRRHQAPRVVHMWFRFHDRLQVETQAILPGLVAQAVLIAAAVWLLPPL